MTTLSKSLLVNLYLTKHFSAKEIAKELGLSEHKIRYDLTKHNISIRNRSDANYFKYNHYGEPFNIKFPLSTEEQNLFFLALGLYWGEGGKTIKHSTRLTNSDPGLILAYYKFLTIICQINPTKVHFHLQTFKDNDVHLAKNYWSNKLNIDSSNITSSAPTKSLGRGSYTKISQYGIMTVGVYNIHFHTWMMEQLEKLGYNPD